MLMTLTEKIDAFLLEDSKPEVYHQKKPLIPFDQKSIYFIGREDILAALSHGFVTSKRMALYGLGGIG